ncbi:hypothetical protein [Brevibacillus agri]|uniref:hypothetical protein n=1 Tax=Brevibacillus agri TaxID=51101 RepID=UPI002E2356F7|nr:hypothetical protein [Brevibacillus agri]
MDFKWICFFSPVLFAESIAQIEGSKSCLRTPDRVVIFSSMKTVFEKLFKNVFKKPTPTQASR